MRYLWTALTALAVIWGTVLTVRLLRQRNGACSKRTALASGSLTLSVLFYAGPRVLDAFWKDDLAAVCGLGRLLAAVGVTLFALLLYWIWESRFSPADRSGPQGRLSGRCADPAEHPRCHRQPFSARSDAERLFEAPDRTALRQTLRCLHARDCTRELTARPETLTPAVELLLRCEE